MQLKNNFDVLVTMDNNLPEQQPLRPFNIAVAILRTLSKTLEDLAALVPKLEQLIAGIQPGTAGSRLCGRAGLDDRT